jgi:superfamily II DNA or RNA helicase
VSVSLSEQLERGRLPKIFRGVYAGSLFIERLPLYDGEPLTRKTPAEHWAGLSEVWNRASGDLQARIAALAPIVARELDELREWTPPALPVARSGTRYAELYDALAKVYVERRDEPRVERTAPGPFDERHPGFALSYDAKRGALKISERESPRLSRTLDLSFPLVRPLRNAPITGGVLADHRGTDAWTLAALRAMILALHDGTSSAAVALERELGRPVWDQLLEGLAAAAPTVEPKEWAFGIAEGYRDSYEIGAFVRPAGKAGKWKKVRFDAIYTEDAAPLERDIARVALCSIGPGRTASSFVTLGTPQAHELLRLLAQHPRVHVADPGKKSDPSVDPRADLVAGEAVMRIERAPNGVLTPHFVVEGRELAPHMLANAESPFRGTQRGTMIASAFVPPALMPWIDLAGRVGAQLSFPTEAVAKLVNATKGIAELPRDALGYELEFDPRPALRVEWQPLGGAFVEVFISAHPSAPLVPAGLGPTLFTFEHEGRRVFVERDFKQEKKVVEHARALIPIPLPGDELEATLLFADWLDANPLGLRIEVVRGRRPNVVPWGEAGRSLKVRQEGSWLVLDGALDVAGVKLTLGDVLEAARVTRRFIPAGDGVFLELGQELVTKLRELAVAADLAPEGDIPRVHEAFSPYVAAALDLEELARRFRTRGKKPKVPALDRGKLRAYQKEGAAWMLGLASWAPGAVLADDMGLGKTVQTAAVLKARAPLGPQLIVAPASVTSNWLAELARFVPSLDDITVVSYQTLQRQADAFAKKHWVTVVIDEAQYVKNVTAQRTDAVRALSRDLTIALTGTPLENHLGELFSIVDLVFPGLLGSERRFRERFRKPIEGTRDETRLAILGRLLAPFLLRRTRKDVLRELPPREEITVELELSPEEKKEYLALRRVCEQQFSKRMRKEETPAQLRVAIFAAMTRLRQIACSETKITHVVDLARELAAEGNRALVFSQFTSFLTRVRESLARAGLRVAYLAGDTPTAKRKAIVDAFQRGEYDVFCVSLLAGGTGLNLTKASYVIHTDPWWNPAAEEQATSRAHRMGQDEPVTVYRLVAKGTIEEAVLAMHADKRDLAAAVLEGKANTKAISSKDLLDLLRFGPE